MHRGGTSVIARVINLLGLPLCREEDLYASPGKPTGHWESTSLAEFNDRLLAMLGGSATAPAVPPACWARHPRAVALYDEACRVFFLTHPTGAWVWKDPRTCLTLPFWREALPEGPVAVLIHREPLEVVRSLQRREGLGKAHCIALWERYFRFAVSGAAGMPLAVVRFADLVADPVATVARLRADLAGLGVPVRASTAQAAGFVEADRALHRTAGPGLGADRDATDAQRFLVAVIEALPPASDSFAAPELGAESASTTELLAALRGSGTAQPGLRAVTRGIWPAVRRSAGHRLARRG